MIAVFLSYDGLTDPLGQSQVLPYLEGLAAAGHRIHVVSAEKPEASKQLGKYISNRVRHANIIWHPVRYHKWPPILSSMIDMVSIIAKVRGIARHERIDVVHARNLFMAVTARFCVSSEKKILFDTRGFWADERIDGGMWSLENPLHRLIFLFLKRQERELIKKCLAVTVLTRAAKQEIDTWNIPDLDVAKIQVITTCADLERFRPGLSDVRRPFTLGYVGSVGTWYLFDEMLAFFVALSKRRSDARLLIVNRNDHAQIRAAAAAAGIADERLELVAARHDEVPVFVRRMDAAVALIRPCFSKIASAPTKLGEYLGCGVPCLGNTGVGDMEEILEGEGVGVALRGFSAADFEDAVDRLLKLCADRDAPARCRAAAERLFSLENGVAEYEAIYRRILGASLAVRPGTVLAGQS